MIFGQNKSTGKLHHKQKENHQPVASHWQTLSHNVVSSTPRHEWDCTATGSCKKNPTTIPSRP
jgi:hypothetical protein